MRLLVTGTDTNVGKTVFAAGLVGTAGASYWKPFQAGLAPPTDSEIVAQLSGAPPSRIHPEAYRLRTPASVHRAAELDEVEIDPSELQLPRDRHLIVEGAGGALVPVTRQLLMADLFAHWALPAVIVARTSLGTINHSLLTIEALRSRRMEVIGVAFVGEAHEDSERTICEIGRVRRLGRLPYLEPLDHSSVMDAFERNFAVEDFW